MWLHWNEWSHTSITLQEHSGEPGYVWGISKLIFSLAQGDEITTEAWGEVNMQKGSMRTRCFTVFLVIHTEIEAENDNLTKGVTQYWKHVAWLKRRAHTKWFKLNRSEWEIMVLSYLTSRNKSISFSCSHIKEISSGLWGFLLKNSIDYWLFFMSLVAEVMLCFSHTFLPVLRVSTWMLKHKRGCLFFYPFSKMCHLHSIFAQYPVKTRKYWLC